MSKMIRADRVFAGLVLVTLVSSFPVTLLVYAGGLPRTTASVSVHIIRLAYAFWVCRRARVSLPEFCRFHVPRIGPELLLFLPITGFAFILCQYVNRISLIVFRQHVSDTLAEASSLPVLILTAAILPALTEEIIFRGLILNAAASGDSSAAIPGRSKAGAILLSAGLFAVFHMNFNQISYAFVMGLLLGFIVLKTGNLTHGILVHFLFNGLTVLRTFYAGKGWLQIFDHLRIGSWYLFDSSQGYSSVSGLSEWGIGTGAALISLIFLILLVGLYCRLNGKEPSGDTPADLRPPAGGFSPSFAVSVVVCILISFLNE